VRSRPPSLILFSLDRKELSIKNGIQRVAGILGTALGAITIITGRIQSWTNREMGARGSAARFIGVFLLVMSIVILLDWVKKFRNSRKL
jgi:uncharacterized membrane protein